MSWPTFPIPKSSLVADVIQSKSGGKPVTQDDLIMKTVNGHPLNQVLQLVVPIKVSKDHRGRLKDAIDDVKMRLSTTFPLLSMMLNGSLPPTANETLSFFNLTNIPLHLLYHKIFIDSYVKKGTVYCTSVNCDIVTDDCLAITPSGQLILSLTIKSYQRLGLEGKPSALKKKNVIEKKTIEIDLKSDLSQRFDSNYYKRTFNCMRNSRLKFDIIIRWQPNCVQDPDISSESIGNYFQFMKNNPETVKEMVDGGSLTEKEASQITINPCLPTIRSFVNARQIIPSTLIDLVNTNPFNVTGDLVVKQTEHYLDLLINDTLDFMGASLCSIKTQLDSECVHISSFGFDSRFNKFEASQVVCCETHGLIPVEFVNELLEEVQGNALLEEIPFIAMIVSGFENSLISYTGKRNEKGKDLSGENIYGLLFGSVDDELCQTKEEIDDDEETGERKEKRIKIEPSVTICDRKPNKCLLWRLSDSFDYSIEKL